MMQDFNEVKNMVMAAWDAAYEDAQAHADGEAEAMVDDMLDQISGAVDMSAEDMSDDVAAALGLDMPMDDATADAWRDTICTWCVEWLITHGQPPTHTHPQTSTELYVYGCRRGYDTAYARMEDAHVHLTIACASSADGDTAGVREAADAAILSAEQAHTAAHDAAQDAMMADMQAHTDHDMAWAIVAMRYAYMANMAAHHADIIARDAAQA